MEIKDHCLYLNTVGAQLSLSVILLVFCSVGFFIIDAFEKAGFLNLLLSILKGIFAAGGIYLLIYSALISKDLTKKYYNKK